MRRALQLAPLLLIAPLGHFLGSYLAGFGVVPDGGGFLISAVSMFVLPWLIAALSFTLKMAWRIRVLIFVGTMFAQGVLFIAAPPGAASEMLGIAHRLRREFPPEQISACATNLRQRKKAGTLVPRRSKKISNALLRETAVLVDDSELPIHLRGRFEQVFIQSHHNEKDEQVYYALDYRTGIVCDSRKDVWEVFVCSMADGVHAYRYQRP